MSLPKINLVIIGHKDHGKSTLIGRVLYDSNVIPEQKLEEIRDELKKSGKKEFQFSFLLDSLQEERRGGLTIDIMQTPFKTKKRLYTIIDCPGHKGFIKNMLTGVSQADAAVLVVSAKDGIQDQTKEHAFLTKTLGINQLVVAVNKMDQVDYREKRFKEVSEELDKILSSLGYEKTPIIPVSAMNGDNIMKRSNKVPWYSGLALIETLDKTLSPSTSPKNKSLRGCVQDVYNLEKRKILVCKVETGILERGKEIIFQPSGQRAMLGKIEMLGKEIETAEPGDSVGLVAEGIQEIKRGEVVSYPEDPSKPIESFIAVLMVLTDFEMHNDDVLTIRYGTAEKKCRIQGILEKIDTVNLTLQQKFPKILRNGDVGKVEFIALEPLCLESYSEIPELGRFVVEGTKGTAAAGIVLEVGERAKQDRK